MYGYKPPHNETKAFNQPANLWHVTSKFCPRFYSCFGLYMVSTICTSTNSGSSSIYLCTNTSCLLCVCLQQVQGAAEARVSWTPCSEIFARCGLLLLLIILLLLRLSEARPRLTRTRRTTRTTRTTQTSTAIRRWRRWSGALATVFVHQQIQMHKYKYNTQIQMSRAGFWRPWPRVGSREEPQLAAMLV